MEAGEGRGQGRKDAWRTNRQMTEMTGGKGRNNQWDKEVILLGDFNLPIEHKANYTYGKMSRMSRKKSLT